MAAPALTNTHQAPCAELIDTQKTVARHSQQLSNNTDWQERLDRRVDQLTLFVLGALSSGLIAAIVAVLNLLKP